MTVGLKRIPDRARDRLEHLDALMDSYLCWRAAARTVRELYRDWSLAGRPDRAVAFTRYAAALDHEEEAAARHRRTLQGMLPQRPLRGQSAPLPSGHRLQAPTS